MIRFGIRVLTFGIPRWQRLGIALPYKSSGVCALYRDPKLSLRLLHSIPNHTPSYVYHPLSHGEIRLLVIHPGDQSTINCSIRHALLSQSPQYEALSYCWGDTKRNVHINCNDLQISVTENLCSALHRLRRKNVDTILWVDAICINQQDLEERSSQVRLMRYIYQRSRRTVVWLGESADNSKVAILLVQSLSRTAKRGANKKRNCPSWYHGIDGIPPLYSSTWRAFSALMKRPWFYRAWIVQEIAVCKDAYVLCGEDMISWNELHQAISYLVDVGVFFMFPEDIAYQVLMIAGTRKQFSDGIHPKLLNLLLRNRSFIATDPRDMVFTLCALADGRDIRTLGVEPNYHISPEEIFTNLAVSLLKSRKDLSLFNAPRVLQHSRLQGKLPSWVPDWSASDPCVPFGFLGPFGLREPSEQPSYTAAGSSTSSSIFDNDKKLLGLSGIVLDQIAATGDVFHVRYQEGGSHMHDLFHQSREIIDLLLIWQKVAEARSAEPYITGGTRMDAYWQTLCAGYMPEGYSKARKEFYRWNKYLWPFNQALKAFGHLFPRNENGGWFNFLFFSLFRAGEALSGVAPTRIPQIGFPPQMVCCNYRRLIRTQKGYIGLAPRYTQAGDHIAILEGGRMPLVLRHKNGLWELIGESYIHGIMNGEAWNKPRSELMWLE